MRPCAGFRPLLIAITCVGLLLPSHLIFADGPQAPPAESRQVDVELQSGNALIGRLLNGHGLGMASTGVSLHNGRQLIAETTTDADGNFRFESIRGGSYQLTAAAVTGKYRAWAHHTAPPGAVQSVLLSGQDVVAGQNSPLKYWLTDPLVAGGLAAVVVGVPTILILQHNDSGS